MSFIKLIAIIIATTFIAIPTAQAQEACGQVIDMNEIGEPEAYCSNIHQRLLKYREERIEYRKKMDNRREEFFKPQLEAREEYEKALADLNKERTHENDVVAK